MNFQGPWGVFFLWGYDGPSGSVVLGWNVGCGYFAGCNGSRDIWDWLWFSCGLVHGGGLGGGLSTRLSFYEAQAIS